MCGIVGIFSPGEEISESALRKGTERLNHRGPDGRRYWIAPHRQVGLGHTRLSIIDLQTGEQPITDESGRLSLVVNGEFYDFENIRSELQRRGHRFKTGSDSEIALHLYKEWGTQCLQHLRGEFSFILWDEDNETLFAGRDCFGIKPLYYATVGNKVYLASEVKALFAAGIRAAWDQESFFQDSFGAMLPHRTLFQGVYQVPPGHYLLIDRHQTRVLRYWDFHYPRMDASPSQLSEAEYIERLRHALNEAVRLRLRADVPVGCYLSGGLDSSTVLGLAAAQSSEPIHTFTTTFNHPLYNEGEIARETASHFGAKANIIKISQADIADNFSDAIWHAEMTIDNASSVSKYLLSRAVRDAGYKVMLTGEGSDEIFAGYIDLRRDMLLYNSQGLEPAMVQIQLDNLRKGNVASSGYLISQEHIKTSESVKRLLGFVPTWIETWIEFGQNMNTLYTSEFRDKTSHRDPYRTFFNSLDVEGQLMGREPVHQSLYFHSKTELLHSTLMSYGDKVDMAHSVEGRLPFLDRKVVELVCQMPVSLKIRGMTEKYVLREAAKTILPDTIYRRPKHPHMAPPPGLKPDELFHQLMQDTMRGEVMESLPFFDRSKIIHLLDKMPQMSEVQRISMDVLLMKILSACFIHERFELAAN